VALEFFAQVNKDGDSGVPKSNDYLFLGSTADFRMLATWVLDGSQAGSHKPTLKDLAARIESAAQTGHYLRFKAKESQLLIEALERKKGSKTKTQAATALLRKLENCLQVY